jgi:hypothetical protein
VDQNQHQQFCPICHQSIAFFPRYPHSLCVECASRAKSKDGRLLKFSNIDTTGGFIAEYADTGESYPLNHECYVDGIQCYADEHRFGGIVIQPVQKRS